MEFYKQRFERAKAFMKEKGVACLFLLPGPNMSYLTGFHINPSERISAAIIPFDDEPLLLVPRLEMELRGQKPWIKDLLIWEEYEDPIQLIVKTLIEKGLNKLRIGVEESVWWGVINKIQSKLPKLVFEDVSNEVYSLRMIKSEEELNWIRKACEITDKALKAGFESLREGMTEMELANTISTEMSKLGGSPHLGIVLFGARAALPHGLPGKNRLKKGSAILVDTGTSWNAYLSDITRTTFFGEPSRRHRRIWNTVLEARNAAYALVAPQIRCEEVDGAARKIIEDSGFGKYFIHRVGHGIGLQVHEHPYIVKGNRLKLQPKMTFTIEPGIYIVGDVGVRIEDTVVCTESGCESLTKMEREIISP